MTKSREWKGRQAKCITFIVTKDCQLACKYCYLVGKNGNEVMSFDIAQKAIDYILAHKDDKPFDYDSVEFDFIGGEPFLEIDLIDQICDYLKYQMYLLEHPWFNSYRFSITTNGINYHTPKVQNFIKKNQKHLSITITIDGTKNKHDINRIWKPEPNIGNQAEERGSYDAVVENIPLWLEQFKGAATKVTISSQDLPYICESVLHLFSLGIHIVNINCVFENVWEDGDDQIFEDQLMLLADSIIDNGLYEEYECSLFKRGIGRPLDIELENNNNCGSGLMLSIDASGNFYPCTRFVQYSLRDKTARTIGNVYQGIDYNKLRPFLNLSRTLQSTKECIECPVACGCAWCQGENYDCSSTGTIFQRSTAICKMHKSRVRANDYYWKKLDGILSKPQRKSKTVNAWCDLDKTVEKPNTVFVLLDDSSVSYCSYSVPTQRKLISLELLDTIITKSVTERFDLVIVYPNYTIPREYQHLIDTVVHKSISPFSQSTISSDMVVINHWEDLNVISPDFQHILLRTSFNDLSFKFESLHRALPKVNRLDIVFNDYAIYIGDNLHLYPEILKHISNYILENWKHGHRVQINCITDRLFLDHMNNCDAGWRSITLAPNGKYYICPAFYYENPTADCGAIDKLGILNPLLFKLNHAPTCANCKAYHCQRCVYLNNQKTLEVNIPSYEQCERARIELNNTKDFFNRWKSIDKLT